MEQDPDLSGFATLGDYAASGLDEGEDYRVEMAAEGLKFRPDTPVASASGGEKRRAALAKLMAEAPELMLLDEPTNHLDIEAIEWLEGAAARHPHGLCPDQPRPRLPARAVQGDALDRPGRRCGGARRGSTGSRTGARRSGPKRTRRATSWTARSRPRRGGRSRASAPGASATRAASARLAALRAERASQIRRQGTAAMEFEAGPTSGKRVIEAKGLTKRFGDTAIVQDFDLRVLRGDRVAFVGPNGVGKTTLLKMLTGEIAPDAGTVTLGHQSGDRGLRPDARAARSRCEPVGQPDRRSRRCASRASPIR